MASGTDNMAEITRLKKYLAFLESERQGTVEMNKYHDEQTLINGDYTRRDLLEESGKKMLRDLDFEILKTKEQIWSLSEVDSKHSIR